MGFVAPFIPLIASAIGGIIGGKKATSAAQKRSPEEATALTGAQGAGSTLASQGNQQFGTGTNLISAGQTTLSQPQSYYAKLLGGNRALQSQAVAAPRGAITDTYRGAERSLEQSGVQGAQRDVAKSEIARDRAGAISSLVTGVQPAAAGALTSIGENQTGQGTAIAGQGINATSGSGNVFSNLLTQGSANRQYARGEGQQTGQGLGSLIFSILQGTGKFGKKPAGGLLPSTNMSSYATMPGGGG